MPFVEGLSFLKGSFIHQRFYYTILFSSVLRSTIYSSCSFTPNNVPTPPYSAQLFEIVEGRVLQIAVTLRNMAKVAACGRKHCSLEHISHKVGCSGTSGKGPSMRAISLQIKNNLSSELLRAMTTV